MFSKLLIRCVRFCYKLTLRSCKCTNQVGDSSKLTPTAKFSTDLGLDSLDTVEVMVAVEEEFGIEIPE